MLLWVVGLWEHVPYMDSQLGYHCVLGKLLVDLMTEIVDVMPIV